MARSFGIQLPFCQNQYCALDINILTTITTMTGAMKAQIIPFSRVSQQLIEKEKKQDNTKSFDKAMTI